MGIEINLSESVKVKLTAFGEAVLAKYRLREFEEIGGTFDPLEPPGYQEIRALSVFSQFAPDESGYRTFQLFELFEIFGSLMSFQMLKNPIDKNTIFIMGE